MILDMIDNENTRDESISVMLELLGPQWLVLYIDSIESIQMKILTTFSTARCK